MATGRQFQLTKQVGEYLVDAELSRRGLLTATFAGNVPDYDIVATGGRGQTALVQVKAIAGRTWQFDIRTFVDVRCTAGSQTMGQPTPPPAGDLICVFVRLHTYGADRFYVLRWPELQRVLINGTGATSSATASVAHGEPIPSTRPCGSHRPPARRLRRHHLTDVGPEAEAPLEVDPGIRTAC